MGSRTWYLWPMGSDRIPLLTRRDGFVVAFLAAMLPVAWALPERAWGPVCRAIAEVVRRARPAHFRRRAETIAWLFGTSIEASGPLVTDIRTNVYRRYLHYLRTLRPGGWAPVVRLEGRERLDAAIARGHGVILWISPMLFSDLVTKMAFARAGFGVTHLSLYVHGFSSTRFGFRVLNRLATRSEERFLVERLVITPERPLDAIRELARRVHEGGLVSMSAIVARGQRSLTVPFLHGQITLAFGAAQLSRRTGAALLPVFTVRLEDGSFVTTIEEPIEPGAQDRDGVAEAAVTQYVQTLERYVHRRPAQYPAFTLGRR